jgi:trehalose-6-phosphate synthase
MEEVAKRIRELNEKYKEEILIVGVDRLYRNRLLQRLQVPMQTFGIEGKATLL